MLVPVTDMLKKAYEGKYAVGQFNINNLEWTKAILTTAQELNSPVILGVSEGAAKYMGGYNTVVGMVSGMIKDLGITIPVATHLDHGSYDGAKAAMEAGFTSIMFDGSHYPIDENIAKTTEMVALAHSKGISIEAEVGSIGGEEDGVVGSGEIASPEECKLIADLGVDILAAGIGNIHGAYPDDWEGLAFDVLAQINEITGDTPLVLHGGTGIDDDQIKKAISLGIAKINVNTELQWAFQRAIRTYIEDGSDLVGTDFDPLKMRDAAMMRIPEIEINLEGMHERIKEMQERKAKIKVMKGKGFDPRKIMEPGFKAMQATVKEKMEIFGSIGKA